MKFRWLLVSFLMLNARLALADITPDKPMNHFFNAYLLDKDEFQISIYTNTKYGISDDFEIGSSLGGLLASTPNLSIKHKMFGKNSYQTSFSSHTLRLSEEIYSLPMLISLSGIITSNKISPSTILNWGIYDVFIQVNLDNTNKAEINSIMPILGLDHALSTNFGLSGFILIPVYTTLSLESDGADIDASVSPKTLSKTAKFGMGTITYSGESFNIEFGYRLNGDRTEQHINLFWKFK